MTSPQLEDGYLRLANELFGAITLFPFTKRQYKIVLSVIRKTYGYGKKKDDISLSQFSELTGLNPSHCSESIKELFLLSVLLKQEGQYAQNYSLNKNYTEWGVPKTGIPVSGIPKTGSKGSQNGNKTIPKTVTTKDNSKNNTKDMLKKFECFYLGYPKKKSKQEALKAFKKINPDEHLLAVILTALERAKTQEEWLRDNGQFIPYPASWLNQKRWEDESEREPTNQTPFQKAVALAKQNNLEPFKGVPHETQDQFIERVNAN